MLKKKIKIVQPPKPELEIPLEILATSIQAIADVGKDLQRSRLSQRAQLLLLRDLTGERLETIKKILDALPELQRFVKK